VATGAGMALVLLPVPTLLLAVVWLAAVRLTGAASAGSVAVAIGFPVAAALVGRPPGEVLAFAACGVLVVARHRGNIERLRHGAEPSVARRVSE
jgi:glycerol-3-phosphate acyltransferase PlsY